MPSLHPLTKDALVLALGAGARSRPTLRRGAFEMLLDPPPDVRTRRVPLVLGRDAEVGDVTLSRTRRTVEFRLLDPPRLLLASAEDARRLLRGELSALPLVEATDDGAAPAPARDEEEAKRRREEHARRLRGLVATRLGRPEEARDDA